MKDLFEQLLKELEEKGLIDESKKTSFIESFENKIKEVKETVFAEALETVDAEHTKLLEQVVEKLKEEIDEEHVELLEQVKDHYTSQLEAMDEEHAEMLIKVKETIEESKDENLVEKVSDYLDTYLEEVSPEKVMVDSVELNRLRKFHESIKEMTFVNDEYVQTEIKEAIEDAQSIMEEQKAEVNQLMLEKVELNKKLEKIEATSLLESKIRESSPKLKTFLESTFKDANKEEIEERFDEAVSAFKEEEKSKREQLVNEAKSDLNPIVKEDVGNTETLDPIMASYVNVINKSMRI